MPHKHKRKPGEKSDSFDLPPASLALPLITSPSQKSRRSLSKRSQRSHPLDDTPRAFAQLLNLQRHGTRLPRGLDDGKPKPKTKAKASANRKRKRADDEPASVRTDQPLPFPTQSQSLPRPNQALPTPRANPSKHTTTTTTSSSTLIPTEKPTKHNRRLLKMQTAWRAEEAKRQTQRAEEREEHEERDDEERALWDPVTKGRGKGKGKKRGGDAAEEDPWAELNRKKWDRQRRLQDVVKAPPVLGTMEVRRGLGKRVVDGGGDGSVGMNSVPKTSGGGLRRREELGRVRSDVIREYRRRMGRGGEQADG